MKKKLLLCLAVIGLQLLSAQETRKFDLLVVAEGTFGTPNGDIFNVTNATGTVVSSSALYQAANEDATGFDVLQDFQIVGDKAILLSKSSGFRVVIAEYPALTHVHTFTNLGAPQTLTAAGESKAYLSSGNPNTIRQIDLATNTATAVIDPTAAVNGSSAYMTYANGFIYAAISSKLVKINPITNTVVSTILPNIGSIAGLQYDNTTQSLWLLGKVSGVSALLKINTSDNDSLETPIILTGVANAAYLRLGNNKLHFLSGKNVHAYNIATPNIPTTALFTSAFTGTWDFAYGKAFDVDPISGDFVIGSASLFTSASAYEIVNGATYALIASGTVPGCLGANEFILKTEEFLNTTLPTTDSFTFYPNPASDTVTFHTTTDSAFTVSIYNNLGSLVRTIKSTTNECKVTIADLPTGIYFTNLKNQSENFTTVKKIIVTH